MGEWLRYDESGGKVTSISCALCTKHKDRLRALRNFSVSFIDGISGTALKKDKLCQEAPAIRHACKGSQRGAIYRSTPMLQ